MTKHFTFGGSTAARTLACPAWIEESKKAPPVDRTSAAAERGTMLHELLFERIFMDGKRAIDVGVELDDDDYDQLVAAEDAIRSLLKHYGVREYECEALMSVADDVGGSVDMIAASDSTVLIIDAKFGAVPVSAWENKQLLFYHMLASTEMSDLTEGREVIGVIIQPSLPSIVSKYEFTREEIDRFRTDMWAAIETARAGTAKPVAGDHCKYCPASAYCDAQRSRASAALLISPTATEMLAEALELAGKVKAWAADVEKEAETVMLSGGQITGWKVVEKKGHRKWNDKAAEVLTATGLPVIESSLVSPAEFEKLAKKAKLELDIKPLLSEPKITLEIAKMSDKRDAVTVAAKFPAALNDVVR
jgi:hypothetical protein